MVQPGTSPLDQLRDIHVPEAISLWPPAPGWWVLAILTAIALIASALWMYTRWRQNRYRREALSELNNIVREYGNHQDVRRFVSAYAGLLKRVALTRFPRDNVAALTGEAWVRFLDLTGGTEEFSMGAGQVLVSATYEANPVVNVEQLHALGRHWILRHRVSLNGAGA